MSVVMGYCFLNLEINRSIMSEMANRMNVPIVAIIPNGKPNPNSGMMTV
jgi:hypothetical protein